MTGPIKRVICYVTDAGFIVPTLLSAQSVRRWVPAPMADIIIFTVGLSKGLDFVMRDYASNMIGTTVTPLQSNSCLDIDPSTFYQSHVPATSLARLVMADAIPSRYTHLTYLDGDTFVFSDIKELVQYSPPPGFIAAAEDPIHFYRNTFGGTGEDARSYLNGLGLSGYNSYFNAGVISSDINTWRQVSGEALSFFHAAPTLCKFHDQSALNVVAAHRRIRISPKWNFVAPYWQWSVDKRVEPAIFHFTGPLKPWKSLSVPNKLLNASYRNEFELIAAKLRPWNKLSLNNDPSTDRYYRNYRLRLRSIYIGRLIAFRREFRNIQHTSLF